MEDNVTNSVHITAYTYDKVGNRTRTTTEDTVTYYYYNKLNQLGNVIVYDNNVQGLISQKTYTYDNSGNQTIETEKMTGEKVTDEYDVNNQLTKSVKTKSGETLYTQVNKYNDLGQRISKTDNGVTTYYYYQGGILLYTTDAAGNKTSQNIVGPQDNIIATIRYDNGQHAYFYNKDIRTSVTNVVDESGKGVVSYKYDDYGTTTKYGNADFYNEICYTSGVYDDLTSLYYLNARYYNPSTATFITQDSYRGEQKDYSTWNLYAYCGGNPINYVDPSGHEMVFSGKYQRINVKYGTNMLLYAGAEIYLSRKKGWKYSADFLQHSLEMNPENLVYESDSDLAKTLIKHKKIEKKYNLFKKSGKSKDKYGITFKKGDMFGAFHAVDLYFERHADGAISCELKDTYNFKYEEPKSLTMLANNYAYFSQQIGTLHTYKITVKMWMQRISLLFTHRLRRTK